MTSIFQLKIFDDGVLSLSNNITGAQWPIQYKIATLYDKINTASGRYVVESDWSGSAEELFEQLIPCLEIIRNLLNPIEESFKSAPTSSEYTHGNSTYYDEFQASMYTCRFRKNDGSEATAILSFKNWDLIGVASEDMGLDERNALKQNILLRLKSPEAIQAGDGNCGQVSPNITAASKQAYKPLTEGSATISAPAPEHLKRLQKRWGMAGCLVLILFLLATVLLMPLSSIDSRSKGEMEARRENSARNTLKYMKLALANYYSDNGKYPDTLDMLELDKQLNSTIPKDVLIDCKLTKNAYECTSAHREGTRQYFTSFSSGSVTWQDYKAGNPVKAPRLRIRK